MSTHVDIRGFISGPSRQSLIAGLSNRFAIERDRWLLWLPVAMGCGIAIYFAWPADPGLVLPCSLVGVFAVAAVLLRGGARLGAVLVLAMAVGFAASAVRSAYVAAPVILEKKRPLTVQATVERVERYPAGDTRITLRALDLEGFEENATPERIRLRVRTRGEAVEPGNRIEIRAVLMPPPPPVAPGSFDFARKAWFERLGGVGFAVSGATVLAEQPTETGILDGWRLARFRDSLAQRLAKQAPGDGGAVAVALMTGERGLIPEKIVEDLRAAGLAHLLAISGLHIGLMAGLAFFVVRAGLALVPSLALRYPIKKWAAIAAICAAFFYLMVSGGTVPTQRAFAMTLIVLMAVLIDRLAITMRLVAMVAGAMLLLAPESLLNVSFQMSFAAVIALVAVYEHARSHGWLPGRGDGWTRRIGIYFLGVAITSVVAGLATGYFAVVHFNRFANYGLLANMLAVPVMGLWIMPWAMAAFLLLPFGLESWALVPMTAGIELVADIAAWVAAMPGSVGYIAAVPTAATVLITLGSVWLCLWQRAWRLWGMVPIMAGLAWAAASEPPDILIDEQAKLTGIRAADGSLMLNSVRRSSMAVDTWTRRSGQGGALKWAPDDLDGPLSCDASGCLYRAPSGQLAALVRAPDALGEDCARADVVVSAVPVFGRCKGPETVIDRFDLWREGAHALWFTASGVRIETVAQHQGRRPWSRYARRQPEF